jgi:hypothetical protein
MNLGPLWPTVWCQYTGAVTRLKFQIASKFESLKSSESRRQKHRYVSLSKSEIGNNGSAQNFSNEWNWTSVGTTAVVVTDISDTEVLVMFVTFDGKSFAKYISER